MRINRSATIFNFHSAQLSRCKSQLYWIIGTKSSSHISGSQWERTIIVISLSVSAFCIFDTFQKDCTYSSFHFDTQLTYPFLCIQLSIQEWWAYSKSIQKQSEVSLLWKISWYWADLHYTRKDSRQWGNPGWSSVSQSWIENRIVWESPLISTECLKRQKLNDVCICCLFSLW